MTSVHKEFSLQIIFVIKGLKNNLVGVPTIISLGLVVKTNSITPNNYTLKVNTTTTRKKLILHSLTCSRDMAI